MTYEEACDRDLCQGCAGTPEHRIAVRMFQKTYQLCPECAGGMLQDAITQLPLKAREQVRDLFIKHGEGA